MHRRPPVRRLGRWALVGALVLIGGPAAGGGDAPSPLLDDDVRRWAVATLTHRCLTPAIDAVFNDAVRGGAFVAALGTRFAITDVSTREARLDLTIAKRDDRRATVTLALERIVGRTPDGHAGPFVFYLRDGADPEASGALLAMARTLAERIPDSALAPCRSRADTFATRAVALQSGALAVLIVAAALLVGLSKLRRVGAP